MYEKVNVYPKDESGTVEKIIEWEKIAKVIGLLESLKCSKEIIDSIKKEFKFEYEVQEF